MNGEFLVTHSLRRSVRPLLVCAVAALALAGCSDARKIIGLDRSTPDEFAVVPHAPLTLPPDLRSLPQPQPGAARPQEPSPDEVARAQIFGGKAGAKAIPAGHGGDALVAQAGAIDPDIRHKVNQETTDMILADRSWLDSLLFWQKKEDPYVVVDPKKEQERLHKAEAEGKPVASGVNETGVVPTIERKKKAPLEGLF